MTLEEVEDLLVYIAKVDRSLTLNQNRAKAWHDMLEPAIPLFFAKEEVAEHYKRNVDKIMPGHLNTAWHNHQHFQTFVDAEQARREYVESYEHRPIPEEARRLIEEHKAKFGGKKNAPR
jgi:hypothetical protein